MSFALAMPQKKPLFNGRFNKKTKTETYNFKEFMRGEHKKAIKPPYMGIAPFIVAPLLPIKAFAEEAVEVVATEPTMHVKMMTAFAPIIELVQSLAYPVALLVVLGGGLFVMIGNTEKGFSLIQRAGLGYVLVMMLPMLLDVLVDAMSSVV